MSLVEEDTVTRRNLIFRVFASSTFSDLVRERSNYTHAPFLSACLPVVHARALLDALRILVDIM